MRTSIKGLEFDNKFYWDKSLNPNATIKKALPNCTTFLYGAVIEDGHLPPVKKIVNANSWHEQLTNGWIAIPFDKNKLEVGDGIEWTNKCHVCGVSRITDDKIIISASWYTGEHGASYYDGKFDSRESFISLKQLSDYMLLNYETRFYHCWSLDEEIRCVGGNPQYILKAPLYSVKRNTNKNQIQVMTYVQNVRNEKGEIIQCAEKGYYDVLSTKEDNGYLWYQVEKNRYIAHIDGRVVYYPKEYDYDVIIKENELLKDKLKRIKEICDE